MERTKNIPGCPMEMTLQLISGKRKVLTLRGLLTGTERFSRLMRSVSGTTQRVLISHLRVTEQDGLLTRTVCLEAPPKVECILTETGYSLKPILDFIFAWDSEYKSRI